MKRFSFEVILFLAAFAFCQYKRISTEPIDYYQFWAAGQAVKHLNIPNVYLEDAGYDIHKHFRSTGSPFLKKTAAYWKWPQFTGTPFLYAVVSLFSSGNFTRDYRHFCEFQFAVYILGLLALARSVRISVPLTAFVVGFFVVCSGPFLRDAATGNISAIQTAFVIVFLILITSRLKANWFLGGIVMATAVMLKPTLIFSTAFAGLAAFTSSRRSSAEYVVGVASAAVFYWAWSTVYFCSWMNWYDGYLAFHPENVFNQSFLAIFFGPLSLVEVLAWSLVVVLIPIIVSLRPGAGDVGASFSGPFGAALLTQTGTVAFLLSGHIIQEHYFLLAIPSCFLLLRPQPFMSKEWRVLVGLTAVAAIAISLPGGRRLEYYGPAFIGCLMLYLLSLWYGRHVPDLDLQVDA